MTHWALRSAGAPQPALPPQPLPRFAPGAARPSFAELLSASLSQEGELRAWISENLGYQQARMDRELNLVEGGLRAHGY